MRRLLSSIGKRRSDHPSAENTFGIFHEKSIFERLMERTATSERPEIRTIINEAIKGGSPATALRNYVRDVLFRGAAVNERITFLLTQGNAFGFQEACSDFYKSMDYPRILKAFTKSQEPGRFRGFFEVLREGQKTVMKPHREVISVGDDWLIEKAVSEELVCLASPSRGAVFYIDRKKPFDGIKVADIKSGKLLEEHIAISFENNIGLISVLGKRLTFGDLFNAEESVVKTALLISRIGALDMSARRDSLTGLCTRAEFNEVFGYLVQHFIDTGENTALVMLDLDHFKKINDNHGHLVGDQALIKVAGTAVSVFRATDFLSFDSKSEGPEGLIRSQSNVSRYGGEEIIVLLPGAELEDGINACVRAKKSIESIEIIGQNDERIAVTASMGITTLRDVRMLLENRIIDDDNTSSLSSRLIESTKGLADRGVYLAKKDGRNIVIGIGFDKENMGERIISRRD